MGRPSKKRLAIEGGKNVRGRKKRKTKGLKETAIKYVAGKEQNGTQNLERGADISLMDLAPWNAE